MAIVNHGIETGNAGAGNSGQGFLLSLGAEGAEVKKWQEYLMSQGYGVSANGVFDKATQIATRTWQMQNGLERTGSVNADAYALAGLKVGVEADIDTSAGISDSINHNDTTSPADAKEPEKPEAAPTPPPHTTTTTTPAAPTFSSPFPYTPTTPTILTNPNLPLPFPSPTTPTPPTASTAPTTPSSETEKKEEPQVHPQLRYPNPQLTEPTPTYGNDYVNGDSKAEDPKQDLPPQLVDPNPNLGEKNETAEENLPPQVVDPNPELSGNATYGGDYVNADAPKTEDPAAKLPPQLVDPNPSLDKNQTTAPEDPRQNLPPQLVDPNPDLPKGEVPTQNNTTQAPAVNLPPQSRDPNPELSNVAPTTPTTPTNGVASGAMAGAMAGAGTSSVPENNTPSNPPSKPTTDAPSDAPSYGKDYVNGDAEPTTPTMPTETPSDQNEVDPNQYRGNTTDGGNGDPNAPDNNPTRDEAVKAPPMNYEEFLKSETETSGTSEVTKANDKETAEVLAGLDQKANEGNNTPVKENLSESTTEASTGATSSPANDGQEETPAVYGNTDEDYVPGTTMTWAEYFALQENANSANSNGSTNESGMTNEETSASGNAGGGGSDQNILLQKGATGAEVKQWQEYLLSLGYAISASGTFDQATYSATRHWQKANGLDASGAVNTEAWQKSGLKVGQTANLDPNQNEVDPNQYGGNTTDSGNGDPYASDNNPIREDSQYSDFVNEDTKEETSEDKPTEDTKTESKEETSNADVLAGLAKIRDDGYKLAEETKKNAEAAAIGAYERAITEAETEREKSVIDARNAAAQRRADYGSNAEALANMGLKSSGYSAYLDQQSYETERAETQAANALADYNKRMAGYAKEDADRIAAENYAKSIYDIDTTYQTNLLAADDRASAKDRQTASDFRTILADVGSGAYTKEQALQLARDLGLSEEQIRAIEGAADEYTASVENAKTEAENAASSERETMFKTEVLSNVSFDTTNEALEEAKEIYDLTDEEYNRLVEKRNEEISQTLDKMIRQGDFANFEDVIEKLYYNEAISKSDYQEKWYDAISKNVEGIESESDLQTFLNDLYSKHEGRLSNHQKDNLLESILQKFSLTVKGGITFDGEDTIKAGDSTFYVNSYYPPVSEDMEKLFEKAQTPVVVLFGNVYGKVDGKWRMFSFGRYVTTEQVIDGITFQKNENIPNNSTTVLDREGNNDNKF